MFGQRCCVCVCCDERGRGSWLSLGNIKTHTHTLTCGVALGRAITSDRSDLWSTYLLIAASLFHSTLLSLSLTNTKSRSLALSVAHTDAGDSAATGELSPSSLYVAGRGRAPSDLPPAHATRPDPSSPPSPPPMYRERMLQLNESNPSGIEAIIEAAGTVFCFFRPPLLFLVPFILSRAGGESVFSPF